MPTRAEAIEAVRAIDASRREFSRKATLSVTICIAIGTLLWFLEPWLASISVISFLISFGYLWAADRKRRELHIPILHEFARSLNWYEPVGTELRHVEGYKNRRRFYADPVLLPIGQILNRVREERFDLCEGPPTGEVPRKPPTRKSTSSPPNRKNVMVAARENGLKSHTGNTALQDAEERRLAEGRIAAERQRAEVKRLEEERIAAERLRAEERRLEEERIAAERQRAEQERREFLETPRIHVYIQDQWSDALSIRDIWQLITENEVTLDSSGVEVGAQEPKRLREFPDLAALFVDLAIENERIVRELVNRDRREKEECVKFHGTTCVICGFSFGAEYGEIGKGYIEAHHLRPVADDANAAIRIVNPVADLRPVCANCHRMLHRRKPPYSIEEMIHIRGG